MIAQLHANIGFPNIQRHHVKLIMHKTIVIFVPKNVDAFYLIQPPFFDVMVTDASITEPAYIRVICRRAMGYTSSPAAI